MISIEVDFDGKVLLLFYFLHCMITVSGFSRSRKLTFDEVCNLIGSEDILMRESSKLVPTSLEGEMEEEILVV